MYFASFHALQGFRGFGRIRAVFGYLLRYPFRFVRRLVDTLAALKIARFP
jgi:hypothetical protein